MNHTKTPSLSRSPRVCPRLLVAVFCGGALGGVIRVVSGEVLCSTGFALWQALLCVNAAGSLTLGLFMGCLSSLPGGLGKHKRLVCFFGVGCCGTLTTFSAVSRETLQTIAAGQLAAALGQLALGIVVCVGLAGMGLWIGRRSLPKKTTARRCEPSGGE